MKLRSKINLKYSGKWGRVPLSALSVLSDNAIGLLAVITTLKNKPLNYENVNGICPISNWTYSKYVKELKEQKYLCIGRIRNGPDMGMNAVECGEIKDYDASQAWLDTCKSWQTKIILTPKVTTVPQRLMKSGDLCLIAFYARLNAKSWNWNFSSHRIAEELNMSRQGVEKRLNKLENKGVLKRCRTRCKEPSLNRRSVYIFGDDLDDSQGLKKFSETGHHEFQLHNSKNVTFLQLRPMMGPGLPIYIIYPIYYSNVSLGSLHRNDLVLKELVKNSSSNSISKDTSTNNVSTKNNYESLIHIDNQDIKETVSRNHICKPSKDIKTKKNKNNSCLQQDYLRCCFFFCSKIPCENWTSVARETAICLSLLHLHRDAKQLQDAPTVRKAFELVENGSMSEDSVRFFMRNESLYLRFQSHEVLAKHNWGIRFLLNNWSATFQNINSICEIELQRSFESEFRTAYEPSVYDLARDAYSVAKNLVLWCEEKNARECKTFPHTGMLLGFMKMRSRTEPIYQWAVPAALSMNLTSDYSYILDWLLKHTNLDSARQFTIGINEVALELEIPNLEYLRKRKKAGCKPSVDVFKGKVYYKKEKALEGQL